LLLQEGKPSSKPSPPSHTTTTTGTPNHKDTTHPLLLGRQSTNNKLQLAASDPATASYHSPTTPTADEPHSYSPKPAAAAAAGDLVSQHVHIRKRVVQELGGASDEEYRKFFGGLPIEVQAQIFNQRMQNWKVSFTSPTPERHPCLSSSKESTLRTKLWKPVSSSFALGTEGIC
jgi:hypothetical protein